MKVTREVKTAILVLGSILIFIWGYSYLRGKDLFNSYKTFYVVYDNVEGLPPSAPVTLNGVTVGKVNDIQFKDAVKGLVQVELLIKTDFPISKTSVATLYEPGLGLSGKQIAIVPDMKNATLAEDGDFLSPNLAPGMFAQVGDKLGPLQTKVESTVTSADSLLQRFNSILDVQTQQNLRIAIAELSSTMKEFNHAAHTLDGMLAGNKNHIDATLTNLDKTSTNLVKISDSINQANLGEAVKKLEKSLANVDNILSDVEAGKGTLGKLMKDEAMYNNLNGASKELKELLADVKENPKRYIHLSVFGRKATPYKAPAEEEEKAKNEEVKK
ncbi:MlaD family protein [Flavobacterium sp. RHBU_3]|uniref:MlaD family protein n=1 Tax=Flavobacterium sp. RHBU_3 TaxID=3391184 RepID=UPI00398505E6